MNSWITDLDYLIEQINKIHPDPFHLHSKSEWENLIHEIKNRLSKRDNAINIAEYYRVISYLSDSHSRINLKFSDNHQSMQNHLAPTLETTYPIQYYVFHDGVYITKTPDPDILGSKVISINNKPIQKVAAMMRPFLPIENEIGFIAYLPFALQLPLFFLATGLTSSLDDPLILDLENSQYTLTPKKKVQKLHSIRETLDLPKYWSSNPVLSLEQIDENLIVSIRSIEDTEELTMKQLAKDLNTKLTELGKLPDKGGVKRLLIDIRQNGGGNNFLNQPLIHTIIKHDWINFPGKIYCLIDRWTFSAAINLANSLEQETWTLFVGEPYSGRVNHYGDSETIILPHSQLEVKISALYWQDSDPRDNRPSIIPDISVNLTYDQFLSGQDPAIDAIRNHELSDDWSTYYQKYSPKIKRYRESQKQDILTYFTS